MHVKKLINTELLQTLIQYYVIAITKSKVLNFLYNSVSI